MRIGEIVADGTSARAAPSERAPEVRPEYPTAKDGALGQDTGGKKALDISTRTRARTAHCPDCGAEVRLTGRSMIGEVVGCERCGAQLEVAEVVHGCSLHLDLSVRHDLFDSAARRYLDVRAAPIVWIFEAG